MNFNFIGNKIKNITLFVNDYNTAGSELHRTWIKCFSEGFDNNNITYKFRNISKGYINSNIIVICGFKKSIPIGRCRGEIIDAHGDKNTTIILESPFVVPNTRNRNDLISVGIGNIDGLADHKNENSSSDRWNKLGMKLKECEWRNNNNILLISQNPDDAALYPRIDFLKWLEVICKELRVHTDRPIHFRPHPHFRLDMVSPPDECTLVDVKHDLISVIQNYYALITCNSNAGAEAVISGIPVFSSDSGSIVYDLSFHDISQIENLNDYNEKIRLQWAYDIAYAQWTLEEVSSGLPHTHLGLL